MQKGKLGNFFRNAREEKKIDQKAVAKIVGKTTSTISQIESGNLVPGEKLIKQLCDILGLDYQMAWLMAQVEKARPGLARQTSLANLQQYCGQDFDLVPGAAETDGPSAQELDEGFALVAKASPQVEAGHGRLAIDDQVSGWFAFRRDWLDRMGGQGEKVLMEVRGNSMSPLIEDGDIIMVDLSRRASQLKPGRIYVIADEEGPVVKRVYFGSQPHLLLLVSENTREYPDREIDISFASPIIGRVIWLGRQMR